MKFPANKSKTQTNKSTVKKTNNGVVMSKKGEKNHRNVVQQQRANTFQSQALNNKRKHQKNQQEVEENDFRRQNELDDQVDGMDANYHIGGRQKQQKTKRRENKQYEELMQESGKGFRREKNKYFLQSQKYQGKRVTEEDEDDDEEINNEEEFQDEGEDIEDDLDEEDMLSEEQDFDQQGEDFDEEQDQNEDEQQENNEIQQALSELQKKRQSTSKLIQSQLQSINLQDKQQINQIIKSKSKSTQQEYQQAIALKKLLEIYDKLVQLRYGQQRQLQQIKKYPKINELEDVPQYPPMSHELFTLSRQLENQLISNLSQSLKLYKKLSKSTLSQQQQNQKMDEQTQTDIDLQQMISAQRQNHDNEEDSLNPGRLNVDKIYQLVKSSISQQNSLVEKELIKWSQKTSFLSSTSTAHLSSLLMQTPIGQAKKVLSNWERMANKCQQKRGQQLFKILFEPEQNIHAMSDVEIYDDYDLFIELQKFYLEKINDENEDKEFLSSATMKYLKNKQANQLNHERKQKDVDRKASKNRKIRYNVHTKLLNFMPAVQQNVIQTRDEIVRNMFNCNARVNQEAGEGNTYRGRAELHEDDLIDIE